MAHEYAKEAKESHDRKLKSYGGGTSSTADKKDSKGDATNWAGFEALNTNKQAGMAPLNKKASMSEETNPRIMRKKGGSVHGAQSLKRLDKAPRKGKSETTQTGSRVGAIPTPATQSEEFDELTKFNPGEMSEGTTRKSGGSCGMKKGGKIQNFEARSHESQGAQGKRPFEGHKKGGACGKAKGGSAFEGSAKDEKEDKKLEKKYGMSHKEWEASDLDKKHDKQESMEGLKKGGRAKRASGGGAFDDYGMGESPSPKSSGKSGKGKTTVNIMIGQPQGGPPPIDPMLMAALAGGAGGPPGGPGAAPPPPPPPAAGAGAPPPQVMMAPPAQMPPQGPPPGAGGPPMMRKDGGSVQVPYRKPSRKGDYPAMDFGAGGGFGRKQKIDAYGDKQKG